MNRQRARSLLKQKLDELWNGSVSLKAIRGLRQRERKRVKARKARLKHQRLQQEDPVKDG